MTDQKTYNHTNNWTYIKEYKEAFKTGDAIAIIWEIDDVYFHAQECAEEPIQVSRDQARNILDNLQNKHDANFGIAWDDITYQIEMELEADE